MNKTASEYVVEALEKTGVKRVYGVVGDSLNGLPDALRRRTRSIGSTCVMKKLPPLRRELKLNLTR
jgi:thiamine pyrophosphate-dependent acetolactate synthase large subunit-like protein